MRPSRIDSARERRCEASCGPTDDTSRTRRLGSDAAHLSQPVHSEEAKPARRACRVTGAERRTAHINIEPHVRRGRRAKMGVDVGWELGGGEAPAAAPSALTNRWDQVASKCAPTIVRRECGLPWKAGVGSADRARGVPILDPRLDARSILRRSLSGAPGGRIFALDAQFLRCTIDG